MNFKKIIKVIEIYYRIIFIAFFILYLLCIFFSFFSVNARLDHIELGCIDKPLIHDDYATHFASSINSVHFFMTKFRLWGYDPYHSAGYPSGIILSMSNHWAILFNILFGWILGDILAFKIAVFLALSILPILALYSAKNYGFGKINSLAFSIVSMAFVFGLNESKKMIVYGMYGYLLSVFLSFFVSSIFLRYINTQKNIDWIKFTLLGAFAFFVHPFSAIICTILCTPIFILNIKKISIKTLIKIILSIVMIILINLIWLLPTIQFKDYITEPYPYYTTYDSLTRFMQNTAIPLIIIFILFFVFLYSSLKNKKFFLAIVFLFTFIILFVISFFGSQIGMPTNLFPGRFILPLVLLCLLSISSLIQKALERNNLILLIIFIILLVSFAPSPMKIICGYDNQESEANKILDFIKMNTSENARIHVQDSRNSPYFGSHFTALIPLATKKQILAAPFSSTSSKSDFTQFVDDQIFNKNLTGTVNVISQKNLSDYLEIYNVKYFLIYSDNARKFFESNNRMEKVFDSGRFAIYSYLDSDESFCYRCNATVKADYDIIEVENAPLGNVILKYHYIDTLKIKPESLKIKPIKLLDDPMPFIMIENNNESRFVIYN
ncbi:MAG: hypothetical protein QW041_00120 [Candidatus Pacearchaeota archaeon]